MGINEHLTSHAAGMLAVLHQSRHQRPRGVRVPLLAIASKLARRLEGGPCALVQSAHGPHSSSRDMEPPYHTTIRSHTTGWRTRQHVA